MIYTYKIKGTKNAKKGIKKGIVHRVVTLLKRHRQTQKKVSAKISLNLQI